MRKLVIALAMVVGGAVMAPPAAFAANQSERARVSVSRSATWTGQHIDKAILLMAWDLDGDGEFDDAEQRHIRKNISVILGAHRSIEKEEVGGPTSTTSAPTRQGGV